MMMLNEAVVLKKKSRISVWLKALRQTAAGRVELCHHGFIWIAFSTSVSLSRDN